MDCVLAGYDATMKIKKMQLLKAIMAIELAIIVVGLGFMLHENYFKKHAHVLVINVHGEVISTDGSNPYLGVIMNESGLKASATEIVKILQKYEKDENVKAFILDIDSNGGDGIGQEELEKQFSLMKKPVVSVIRDKALSSGYYVASTTNRIFASELSNVADIGHTTIMEYSKDKINYKKCHISSSDFKRMYYDDCEGFENTQAYKEEKNNLIYLTEIMAIKIAHHRNLSVNHVMNLADGTIFTGIGALKLGLIDQIGDAYDAKNWLEKQLGMKLDLVYFREIQPDTTKGLN